METMQKIRRLRKGRCTAALVLLILAVLMLAGGLFKAKAAEEGRPMQAVVVTQGDTIWRMVQEHYNFKGDIRRAVYEVKKINGLKDTVIVPGQVIYIPYI